MKITVVKFRWCGLERCVSTRAWAGVAFAAAGLFAAFSSPAAAGTAVDFTKNGGLATAGNYSSGSLPTNTTDVLVTTTTAGLTDNGVSLTMESLSLTDSSPAAAYTITNKSTTANANITLGNSAGFNNANSGVTSDLIYLQDTPLTITGTYGTGYGTLGLTLASNGNFDLAEGSDAVASTLTISAVISGNYGITTTGDGTGTIELQAANSFTGAYVANAGVTRLDINGALGGVSSLTVAGGTVFNYYLGLTNSINPLAPITINSGALQTEGGTQTSASLSGTGGTLYIGDYVNGSTITAGSFTVGNSASTTFAGTIVGTHASSSAPILTKQGSGTLTLTGTNTNLSGAIAITAGTLAAAGSSGAALGGITSIAVGSTGTLLMGAANQLNTAVAVSLNGATGTGNAATFGVGGFNQGSKTADGAGALTLTSGSKNNVIDFGGKAGVVTFASLTTNGAILTINNYLNNNGMSGQSDQLIFDQNESANLSDIVFTGYGASTEAALGSGFYEVYPLTSVPEPATVLGGILLLAALGYSQLRVVSEWMAAE